MLQTLVWWVISLLFVIALILLFAVILKKFFMPGTPRRTRFRKGGQRRLEVLENLPLDHKTRLMLIRRDNVNHLLLVGGNEERVIESNITPPPGTALRTDYRDSTGGEGEATPAAKSDFFGGLDGDAGGDGGD